MLVTPRVGPSRCRGVHHADVVTRDAGSAAESATRRPDPGRRRGPWSAARSAVPRVGRLWSTRRADESHPEFGTERARRGSAADRLSSGSVGGTQQLVPGRRRPGQLPGRPRRPGPEPALPRSPGVRARMGRRLVRRGRRVRSQRRAPFCQEFGRCGPGRTTPPNALSLGGCFGGVAGATAVPVAAARCRGGGPSRWDADVSGDRESAGAGVAAGVRAGAVDVGVRLTDDHVGQRGVQHHGPLGHRGRRGLGAVEPQ